MFSYHYKTLILGTGLMISIGCMGGESQLFGYGQKEGLFIDHDSQSVILDGRIYPTRYNTDPERAHGHHAVTWQGGGRSRQALIETLASDYETAVALRLLGIHAGRPLPQTVWSERNNPDSPYPDWRAEGDRILVDVIWDGQKDWILLSDLLVDRNQQGIEIHFEGQEELIPVWESGCIVCLASCPGAKASNSRYTIQDQVSDRMDFQSNPDYLPPDGTPVRVRLRAIVDEERVP